jgi:hypothetical protein
MSRVLSAALVVLIGLGAWLAGTFEAAVAGSTWRQFPRYRELFPAVFRVVLPVTADYGEVAGFVICLMLVFVAVVIARSRTATLPWLLGVAIVAVFVALWSALVVYGAWLPYKCC